jgi:hypothetical protein
MVTPTTDLMLSTDARAFNYRNYESVMPLPEWGELEQWQKERKEIRRHLLLCAGLNAQTAAFKASGRVVRCFEHEGVVIENICIETLPGLYLVGNLYRPKGHKGRLPLILHPHGHAMHARTVPLDMYSVPHRAMNSALLGCAAFAYSMIGYDHDTMQLEHRSLLSGTEKGVANMLGLSMFGLQLNNSIKALDYLLSRRDIDAKRVGCTGESGGATQTYFLAAVDERVHVVAPAVMLSGHFQGGCVCENAPQLHLQYSNLQYAGLIAPRPLLLTGCTGDWTHHAREREFPTMQRLYEMYDAPERVELFYQDEIHNYNRASREAVYAWMVRWLIDSGAPRQEKITESKISVPATDDLLAFDTPVPPYEGAITTQKQLINTWKALHTKAGSAAEIADILPFDVPEKTDILLRSQPSRRSYRQRGNGLHTIRYGRFSTGATMECRFLPPERGRPTFLLLRGFRDGAAWRRFCDRLPASVQKQIDGGCGILVPQLFGQSGSAQHEAFIERGDSYLASTYVPTADTHRADDILTTLRMAQVEMGIRPETVTAVADRDVGLLAWTAWTRWTAQNKAGPLVADLGGEDLLEPRTWARRCYMPLLLGTGGALALSVLGKVKGSLSGVRSADQKLLPATMKGSTPKRTLDQLIAAAAKG